MKNKNLIKNTFFLIQFQNWCSTFCLMFEGNEIKNSECPFTVTDLIKKSLQLHEKCLRLNIWKKNPSLID